MKKILIMTDWFCPGFKAGGMTTASYNLAMLLKDDYEVYMLTSDRDLGDDKPYPTVVPNQWIHFHPQIQVFYASPGKLSWQSIYQHIRQVAPDCIYLNSMYSRYLAIYPLLMRWMGIIKTPIFLSPSGMLKESALQQKPFKKKVYLRLFRLLGLPSSFSFHATDETERKDIQHVFGKKVTIFQVYYAPPAVAAHIMYPLKTKGIVKLVFIGRIHPVKNLHFFIECLQHIKQKVEFTVVGPVEDNEYFNRCKLMEQSLPPNIRLSFTGGLSPTLIKAHLNDNHFLAHPSLGENFGYAIVEAFCMGRPVITTDRTPWRNMEAQQTGWDLPLNDRHQFIEVLNRVADMEQDEYNTWCMSAWSFAQLSLQQAGCRDQYLFMFNPPQLKLSLHSGQ